MGEGREYRTSGFNRVLGEKDLFLNKQENFEEMEGKAIIVKATGTNQNLLFDLRRRGCAVLSNATYSQDKKIEDGDLVVSILSKALLKEVVLRLGLPNQRMKDYSPLEKLQIFQSAIDRLFACKDELGIESIWLAHDNQKYQSLLGIEEPGKRVDTICDYFGPQVALYFGWLEWYKDCLLPLSILGILVYGNQLYSGSIDISLVPVFAIVLALWGTCFLEFWKRKCAHLTFQWGIFDMEDIDHTLELATVSIMMLLSLTD
jgi:hypothetical protein